jgi:hypothetical protein
MFHKKISVIKKCEKRLKSTEKLLGINKTKNYKQLFNNYTQGFNNSEKKA